MDSWAPSGSYTVTHTVYLGPYTTKTVPVGTIITVFEPVPATHPETSQLLSILPIPGGGLPGVAVAPTTLPHSVHHVTVGIDTTKSIITSLPGLIVPSDLKTSIMVPTTLATDTDLHQPPSLTKLGTVATATEPKSMASASAKSSGTHIVTTLQGPISSVGKASSSRSVTTSTNTRIITPSPDRGPFRTRIPLGPPPMSRIKPKPTSAAGLQPMSGLKKSSAALLGLWGVAFVAAWL